ncbi:tetratricopeptide repeat protein [Pseudomonas plecoglossicida]|uniref:tetratricopeptide repeat protein n=1 Tax=Pseudomonas plecoglossicida TaxID=70775 RepID=UPI00051DC42A|nr:tetratricopeptide repeat protein [Pseudomonas plecoglossicida]KGK24419.1 hypothetical protein GT93_05980 [Pseudomonas plecoglossicida]
MKDRASSTENTYTVSGYFEGIEDGHAIGWALLKEQPSKRLKVDIFCENSIVASGFANERREDLVKANIGDGLHLFRLPLSDELFTNGAHTVIAKISGTNILLPGGPRSTGRLVRKREFPLIPRAEGLKILKKLLLASQNKALSDQQEQYNLAYSLGSLLQETGLYKDSEAIWSVFKKTLGESSFIFYKLGEARLLQGDNLGAKENFLKAIELEPTSSWAHIGLGNCFLKSNQLKEAEKCYKHAHKCNSNLDVFKTFASTSVDMQIIAKAEGLLSNKNLEEAAKLLCDQLYNEPYSPIIERKYNETLCLLHTPTTPHLDIVVKTKTKAKLLQIKIRSAEKIIESAQLSSHQKIKIQRSASKDRK